MDAKKLKAPKYILVGDRLLVLIMVMHGGEYAAYKAPDGSLGGTIRISEAALSGVSDEEALIWMLKK